MAKAASIKKMKYEEAREKLESIIEQVEAGEIGLEDSLKSYEQGMALIRHCRSILDQAETRIQELQASDLPDAGGGEESSSIAAPQLNTDPAADEAWDQEEILPGDQLDINDEDVPF